MNYGLLNSAPIFSKKVFPLGFIGVFPRFRLKRIHPRLFPGLPRPVVTSLVHGQGVCLPGAIGHPFRCGMVASMDCGSSRFQSERLGEGALPGMELDQRRWRHEGLRRTIFSEQARIAWADRSPSRSEEVSFQPMVGIFATTTRPQPSNGSADDDPFTPLKSSRSPALFPQTREGALSILPGHPSLFGL